MKPKIIFMGTPDFSVPILIGLINKYKVDLVVTQPDKPVGRNKKIKFSPVKEIALKNNIKCIGPNKVSEIKEIIKKIKPDLIITCAYGQILPKEILDIPPLGCINVHASLLPKLRGGAPIHRSIIEGHKKTGITIMYMDEKMDQGDIIEQREIEIKENDTTEILHNKLSNLGSKLLLETIPNIINKKNKRIKQNDKEATYANIIKREDEKIDFNKTAKQIYNQIRGLNSFPGAYCLLDNKVLKVWQSKIIEQKSNAKIGQITKIYKEGFAVKVKDSQILFTQVQPSGKSKMNAKDFANGHKLVGKVLQ